MRKQFLTQASLLILTLFSSHSLVGQDVSPAHGQLQEGDRRGS